MRNLQNQMIVYNKVFVEKDREEKCAIFLEYISKRVTLLEKK